MALSANQEWWAAQVRWLAGTSPGQWDFRGLSFDLREANLDFAIECLATDAPPLDESAEDWLNSLPEVLRGPWTNRRGPAVPKSTREGVFERDDSTCQHCGTTEELSIDHIVPRSRGGSNERGNLQVLCRRCNTSKGARV